MTISTGTKESLELLVGSLTPEAKEFLDVLLFADAHEKSIAFTQDEEYASAAIVDVMHILSDIKAYIENCEYSDEIEADIAEIVEYHGVNYDSL